MLVGSNAPLPQYSAFEEGWIVGVALVDSQRGRGLAAAGWWHRQPPRRGERQSKRMCIFHWTRWLPSSIHLLLAWGWVANTKRHEHYILPIVVSCACASSNHLPELVVALA
jgi:hypothetical protein